jgi:hypothetical protein
MNVLLIISILLINAVMTGERCYPSKYNIELTGLDTTFTPTSINVITEDNVIHEAALWVVTDGTAHYVFDGQGQKIIDAFVYVDAMWIGEFRQGGCVKPTAVELVKLSATQEDGMLHLAGVFLVTGLFFFLVYAIATSGRRK